MQVWSRYQCTANSEVAVAHVHGPKILETMIEDSLLYELCETGSLRLGLCLLYSIPVDTPKERVGRRDVVMIVVSLFFEK
jgi:hypothetical protein